MFLCCFNVETDKGSLPLTHHCCKATKSMAEAAQLVDRGNKAGILTVAGWKMLQLGRNVAWNSVG